VTAEGRATRDLRRASPCEALLRAHAVSAFILPPAFSHATPVLFPSSAGVTGRHGRWLGRKSAEDPEYELSQATSLFEDSWSDVMMRHRMRYAEQHIAVTLPQMSPPPPPPRRRPVRGELLVEEPAAERPSRLRRAPSRLDHERCCTVRRTLAAESDEQLCSFLLGCWAPQKAYKRCNAAIKVSWDNRLWRPSLGGTPRCQRAVSRQACLEQPTHECNAKSPHE
jgi:hypothetical protein